MPSALKARQSKPTVPARAISNKALIALSKPRNKYNARKTPCVGHLHLHDSGKEAGRCYDLRLFEKDQRISDLRWQPEYKLFVQGMPVCKYRADFCYMENGERVVEDVKGHKTAVYNLKKKLMRACLGITIRET